MATGYINNRNRAGMVQVHIPADQLPAADDANAILTKLLTVDGASSGLDADLLDGAEGAAFGKLATANTWAENNYFSKNVGVGVVSPQYQVDVGTSRVVGGYSDSTHWGSYTPYDGGTGFSVFNHYWGGGSGGFKFQENGADLVTIWNNGSLDLTSTTGALLVPRLTTTQRDALTAADGMVIYNTTTATFQVRQNSAWVSFTSAEATTAALSFGTGWGNYENGYADLRVTRSGNLVTVSGSVARSTTSAGDQLVATLNSGYRPGASHFYAARRIYYGSTTTYADVTIASDGTVTVSTSQASAITWLHLGNMVFPTD